MERAVTIELMHETPGTHGVHDTSTVQKRMRYATRKSVSRNQFYQSAAVGITPTCIFKLALAQEYDEQLELLYDGRVYMVTRTYETPDGGIELTAQRRQSND